MSFPWLAINMPNLILVHYFESLPRSLCLHIIIIIFLMYLDIQSSESLSQVAAIDIDKLLSKAPEISEKVLFNVQESLLKDWGPESVSALPEDAMQQLLTEDS